MSILVLHDFGTGQTGEPWATELAAAGPVLAPDLPGHGSAPPPVGNNHDVMDPVFTVMRTIVADPEQYQPTNGFTAVVGIGARGWPAHTFALAGRAQRLVLVDGLGGPFVSADERMATRQAMVRTIVEMQPATDQQRLELGIQGLDDYDMAIEAAEATAGPTLLVRTPLALLDDAAHADVAHHYRDATVIEAPDRHPATVAPLILDWLHDQL